MSENTKNKQKKDIDINDVDDFLTDIDNEVDNFDEVLELTTYEEGESGKFLVANYDNINIIEITNEQKQIAETFVSEARKLILSYSGDASTEIQKYLTSIANLQLNQLGDLLALKEVNKQMLNNLVERINSVQADDYALIQTYTSLLQQHMKLHKELRETFTTIPALMRKMVIDINTELIDDSSPKTPIISENYGKSQFNNSKELLKKLKQKQEQNKDK